MHADGKLISIAVTCISIVTLARAKDLSFWVRLRNIHADCVCNKIDSHPNLFSIPCNWNIAPSSSMAPLPMLAAVFMMSMIAVICLKAASLSSAVSASLAVTVVTLSMAFRNRVQAVHLFWSLDSVTHVVRGRCSVGGGRTSLYDGAIIVERKGHFDELQDVMSWSFNWI